jgi:5-methylcytosine-specific restriction protein B
MEYIYSWIPAYQQIVTKLQGYRNLQIELINILRNIGVNVNEDEDIVGHRVPLTEIDPFTFLFFLGKQRNDWNKVKTLRKLCEQWEIEIAINDVCGIPSANAQKLWMFPYKYSRRNEIELLWDFFEKSIADTINDTDFAAICNITNVGKQKITEGLFLVNPERYLCLNSKVKPYVQSFGLNTDFENYTQLKNLYEQIKNTIHYGFHEISFKGYIQSTYGSHKPSYFRIGTTAGEGGESQLEDMIANNIVTIGWEKLGNLNEIDTLNKRNIQSTLQENGYYEGDNRTASRKAGEIIVFLNEITPGDFVLAADGGKILAIGKVISNHYVFDSNLDFPHCRCVEWIKSNIVDLSIDEGLRTTVWKYYYENNIAEIQTYLNGSKIKPIDNYNHNMSLNQIFFGPPGTGKTYSTIDAALEILGENISGLRREERKKLFSDYQKKSRIFFTTFHQSMSYEDFIEGIKPINPKDGDEFLQYKIQDGLFMRATIEATYNYINLNYTDKAATELLNYNQLFDNLFDRIEEDRGGLLPARKGGEVNVFINDNGNFIVKHLNGEKPYTVSRERLRKIYEAYPDPDAIVNVQEAFRKVIGGCNSTAFWSVLKAIVEIREKSIRSSKTILDLSYEDKRQLVQEHLDSNNHVKPVKDLSDPFVFIIDEINRGNVSQIFGELITLIEDDKRLGKPEELLIELTYSKKTYSIPPNLFILGTMNTADRSVESLDTALRRRFEFIPKLSIESKIENFDDEIDLAKMLKAINNRLKILKDADHTIGHAWLMNITSLDQLKFVFGNKILPLLQEYFYNDYEKLGLVLGDAFFELPHKKVSGNEFATFGGGTGLSGQYKNKYIYKLKSADALTITDFLSLSNSLVPDEQQ